MEMKYFLSQYYVILEGWSSWVRAQPKLPNTSCFVFICLVAVHELVVVR